MKPSLIPPVSLSTLVSLLTLATHLWLAQPVEAQTRGWKQMELPESGGTAVRFIPGSVNLRQPQALIVFLHGAGGAPHHYQTSIMPAAALLNAVVVMPEASNSLGWGFGNDVQRVFESIDLMKQLMDIDPERISISGHSAGGGFGLLLGLAPGSIFSSIFQLSSPFVQVNSAPTAYQPPLRQYYGQSDINFQNAFPDLSQQWDALDLDVENQLAPRHGHSTWPDGTFEAGFAFLLGQTRPKETIPGFEEQPPVEQCSSSSRLCLLDDRFEVTVSFVVEGEEGDAQVATQRTDDSGLFWFFNQNNWEVLVKMIDACSFNGHFWVYTAATTDLEYTLTVRDRVTKIERLYTNQGGEPARANNDNLAFATCEAEI